MEPIKHTLTARFENLKMYREDLDQLVGLFHRSCEKVTISDSKYRYDSLEEMKQNTVGPSLKDLEIRGENPGVIFLINQTEPVRNSDPPTSTTFNELRTEEITDAANLVFHDLKDFLSLYQQPRFRKEFLIFPILSTVGIFWFALHNAGTGDQGHLLLGSLPGFLVCLFGLALSISLLFNVKNYMSLEMKGDSAPFLVKHREEFAKQSVTAIISSIIALAIGYIMGHYCSAPH